jgi:hypothetical protein
MSEWWTYTLSDLQIFSARTYARLFESYNAAVWPGHALALALGLFLVVLIRRPGPRSARTAAAFLAAAWLWVAVAFHWQRFASIHWAGHAFAVAFALEAALLLVDAARGRAFAPPESAAATIGLAVLLFALFLQPLAGLLLGRAWASTEVFGLAPDPTALATIGVALACAGRRRWILLVIPAAWCAVSGATLLATRVPGAWMTPAAAAAAAALLPVIRRKPFP